MDNFRGKWRINLSAIYNFEMKCKIQGGQIILQRIQDVMLKEVLEILDKVKFPIKTVIETVRERTKTQENPVFIVKIDYLYEN